MVKKFSSCIFCNAASVGAIEGNEPVTNCHQLKLPLQMKKILNSVAEMESQKIV
jgi:hypothetical protein